MELGLRVSENIVLRNTIGSRETSKMGVENLT
jgi:hypothetical protein